MRQGKASPHTSLTPDDVNNIRAARDRGEDARDVADMYDVAPSTIRKIWRGETFRHIGVPGVGTMAREKMPMLEEPTQEEKAASLSFLQKLYAEQQAGENMVKEIKDGTD